MAVASLVLGVVGALFGLIPILFWIAIPCGVLGLVFGFTGRRRAKQGATGRGMALAGIILSAIACVLGVVGIAIVNDAFEDLDAEFERIEREIQGS